MFLNIAATLITILTFVAIIRKVEVRLALLAGGLAMALLAGNPQAWSAAFLKSMTVAGLISVILPVMGFAAVMELTECDRHLVKLLTDPLIKVRALLVPGAMLVTYVINTALPSAAGCAAAVGVVLIPAMMAAGVHPAMAAAAVLAGTWGSMWSPGSTHPAVIAKIANGSVMQVILAHKWASGAGALIVAGLLLLEARLRKEGAGWTVEKGTADLQPKSPSGRKPLERVHVLKATVPVLPLILLLLTVPQLGLTTRWLPQGLTVLEAMVIGTLVGMLVTGTGPTTLTKTFFEGMGRGYGGVIGVIIAAGVFIGGLEAAGAVKALIATLQQTQSAAPLFGMFGPFVLAVLCGSGDAATLAFNNAVTPHAAQFGMSIIDLGNLAWLGGALGRSMSPVAACTIVAAGFAGVSPFELAKRTAVPMLVAAIAALLILSR